MFNFNVFAKLASVSIFRPMSRLTLGLLPAMLLAVAPVAWGAADPDGKPKVEVLASGLNFPCGVAVREYDAAAHEIFVAEGGAGRVVRLRVKKTDDSPLKQADDKVHRNPVPFLTGFSRSTWGQEPAYPIAPLSLLFKQTVREGPALFVGDGGRTLRDLRVRVYTIPNSQTGPLSSDQPRGEYTISRDESAAEKPGDKPGDAKPSDAKPSDAKLSDAKPSDAKSGGAVDAAAPSYLHGMVIGGTTLFVAVHGAGAGAVLSFDFNSKDETLTPLVRDAAPGLNSPTALAFDSRDGGKTGTLAVGQMGQTGDKPDSILAFYGPRSGKPLLHLPAGLRDLVALAYSPSLNNSRQLYALDFAWTDAAAGGLFRLDSTVDGLKPAISPTRILPLAHPAAMAFAADGTLYLVEFGAGKPGTASGRLLRVQIPSNSAAGTGSK